MNGVPSLSIAAESLPADLSRLLCDDGTRPRVILAEDSTAARILTAVLLRRMGCDVDAAEHGEEALSHLLAKTYDVVILDIEMPVMDGVTTARKIRTLGGSKSATPIVAFSAFLADTQADVVRALFDGLLAKPASRAELRAVLRKVLAARPRGGAPAGARPAAADPVAYAPSGPAQLATIKSEFQNHSWRDFLATALGEFRQDLGTACRAFAIGEFIAQGARP